ncbi:hypothetical protein SCUP515_01762 [Seiridium cupressi]
MGGFTVNTSIEGQQFIPDATKMTLSVKLIKFVARLGDLPDFPVEVIKDKSKADALAKSLAIMQAGWFVLQAITRQASGLMVTPLELSTLAHAVCALVVYYLWWDKPLDVQSSTDVPTGEQIAAIVAVGWEYRFMETLNMVAFYSHLRFSFKRETILRAIRIQGDDGRLDEESRRDIRHYAVQRIKPDMERPSMAPNILIGNLFHGDFLRLSSFFQARDGHISRISLVSAKVSYSRPNHHESRHPVPMQCKKFVVLQRKDRFGSTEVAEVYRAMGNYTQWASTPEPVAEAMALIVFFFCTLAYGGVHVAAWNHYFPSRAEQFLWRIAAIGVAAL